MMYANDTNIQPIFQRLWPGDLKLHIHIHILKFGLEDTKIRYNLINQIVLQVFKFVLCNAILTDTNFQDFTACCVDNREYWIVKNIELNWHSVR